MNFHEVNFPDSIGIFAVGICEFSTSCAITISGRETRSSDNVLPRRKYELRQCIVSINQFELFNRFFIARAGKRFGFRLKDHFDFTIVRQSIAKGDGCLAQFQLKKIYYDEYISHTRIITKPRRSNLKFWIGPDEIEAQEIDLNTGIITLSHPLPQDQELIASCEFDVPVRFVHDNFTYNFNPDGSVSLENIEMIEVLE